MGRGDPLFHLLGAGAGHLHENIDHGHDDLGFFLRGSATTAAPPSRMEAMMIRGVSFESMKKLAILPAGPNFGSFFSLHGRSVG